MGNQTPDKHEFVGATSADRRAQILAELQSALVRQSCRRQFFRIGQALTMIATGCGILGWYLFTNSRNLSTSDGIAGVNSGEIHNQPGKLNPKSPTRNPAKRGTIVHTDPELLKSVLVTNHDLASKSVVETVTDDELFELLATSSASVVVARIDNRLVAVPLRTRTNSRTE